MLDYDKLRRSSAVAEEQEEELESQVVERRFSLGSLTPPQRFILALMLFLNVLIIGCLCLVAADIVSLPF